MFSLVLHATARVSRNGRVRGYRNMTIPELVKFTSADFLDGSMDSDHTGTSTAP
jgi:hypothetical protein